MQQRRDAEVRVNGAEGREIPDASAIYPRRENERGGDDAGVIVQ
jgi:hypothetical protein